MKMRPFDGHFDFLRHHKTSCVPSFPIGRQEVFPFAENKKNLTSEEVRFCRVLTEKMRSGKFQASIASYIESYNTQMPHRTLKNLTPCQVEENSIEKAE